MRLLLAFVAAATFLCAADAKYGKPLTLDKQTPIATLLAKPGDYAGKLVQVKGKITEVCQEMGCWLYVADENGNKIRIKVKDGEIVFPKDGAGRTITAEGVFAKLTPEQAAQFAREEAKDRGKKLDPAAKSETAAYQIQGAGAVISD